MIRNIFQIKKTNFNNDKWCSGRHVKKFHDDIHCWSPGRDQAVCYVMVMMVASLFSCCNKVTIIHKYFFLSVSHFLRAPAELQSSVSCEYVLPARALLHHTRKICSYKSGRIEMTIANITIKAS